MYKITVLYGLKLTLYYDYMSIKLEGKIQPTNWLPAPPKHEMKSQIWKWSICQLHIHIKQMWKECKGISPSNWKKMVPQGGLDLHKRLKNTSKYIGKLYKDFDLTRFLCLKDNQIPWSKNNTDISGFITYAVVKYMTPISKRPGEENESMLSNTAYKMVYCWGRLW